MTATQTRYTRQWRIDPRAVLERFRSGQYQSARDLSWSLIGDTETCQLMEETEAGDTAENNFALSVVEHALDWRLGLAVVNLIAAAARERKMPKPFTLGVTRNGEIWYVLASGRTVPAFTK